MIRFIFIFSFLPFVINAQEIITLKPNNHYLLELSLKGQIEYLQYEEKCEDFWRRSGEDVHSRYEKLSKKDKALYDYCLLDKGGYWDIGEIGCSWYCGGGPDSVTASSALKPYKGLKYDGQNAHDLSYKTAWVEGDDGDGIGEYLLYHFSAASPRITKIIVVNGYVKSSSAWKNNSRVKKLKMYIDDKALAILYLSDTRGEQSFDFEPIGLSDRENWEKVKGLPPWTMKFEILEIYPGAKYKDVAITEIYFDGIDVHCLAKGTEIAMADNTIKNVEELELGESVLSFNPESNLFEPSRILELASPTHDNLVEVKFSNGNSIVCTKDHPIMGAKGQWLSSDPTKTQQAYEYKGVSTLMIGSEIISSNQANRVYVTEIADVFEAQQTFTIVKLEKNNSFIANGIIVGTEELRPSLSQYLDRIEKRLPTILR